MRILAVLSLVFLSLAASGCGKDEADFNELKGQVGVVAGNFNMRLAAFYRDKIDALQGKVDSIVPGITTSLTQRFKGSDDTTDGSTKLSDLVKVKIPGTESEVINQQMMRELQRLTGEGGAYFDVVDTEKYLKTPSYVPPTSSDASYDPEMGNQYYLDMIRWYDAVKGIDSLLAGAKPVVVAVLDTGVLATHEDLTSQMWQGLDGEVGYDATLGQPLAKSASTDVNGHGTHVAGIIGASGGNGKGIHGVGYVPGAGGVASKSLTEIMAVKVLNDNGAGTSTSITDGLKWAVDQHWAQKAKDATRAKQKLVVNMSLGGAFEAETYPYKKDAAGKFVFEDDLFNYATSKNDVLIVVAAGNESCGISGPCDLYGESYKQTYYFPCSYNNVLCVAATTYEDKLAGFSNRKGSVGIAAPGHQIESTIPTSSTTYGYYSGTSQATPVTSGAASVVWALYPDLTATDLKAVLQKTASKVGDITAQITSADGRLDLAAALTYAAALKSAGKTPAEQEPASGVVLSDKQTPKANPPAGQVDPNAPSNNAIGDSGPEDKGDGSANGCGVVADGRGQAMALWTLLLPLAFLQVTSFRSGARSRRNAARNP